MLDVLPTNIAEKIRSHLRRACSRGEQGWESGQEEEDTLTGDLCSSMRRNWTRPQQEDNRRWRWRVTYSKFRGRGAKATEKVIGADGIVQIEVEDLDSKTIETKGLLFQAKKSGSRSQDDLLTQARRMHALVPDGAAVFEYGPQGYEALDATDAIDVDGNLSAAKADRRLRLGDYLADRFVICEVGKRGLYYEATRKTLFVPQATKGVVRIRRELSHRVRIEVQALRSRT